MFPLRCTVRSCGLPLGREGNTLRCTAGHAFDRAREGYWNLLQPQDRRSSQAGDADAALDARARWIEQGHVDGLVATVGAVLERIGLRPGAAVADLGSGDGTFTGRLLRQGPWIACGVELAVAGARRAARRFPDITWVVANADRGLPFPDASLELLLSVFGRRPAAEMARVLSPTGRVVVVVAGEDDLIELREAVQGEGRRRPRLAHAVAGLESRFELAFCETWREQVRLDRRGLADALALTYRGARRSERERLAGTDELAVTLSADVAMLCKRRRAIDLPRRPHDTA